MADPNQRATVGRYRVTGILGEGGMGVVYAAHDRRPRSVRGRDGDGSVSQDPERAAASAGGRHGGLPSRLLFYTDALRHLILGDRDRGLAAMLHEVDMPDPEGRYYVARHLIHLGETERGLAVLSGVVDDGFFCLPALTRDPWLDPVRTSSAFADIARKAEARHRRAVISFLSSEGDRVLGVPYPV